MSKKPIEFYFEFNSPYGYVAAHMIDHLAERYERTVDWHAMLLGPIFKETGARPMREVPIKGAYIQKDAARTCRYYGVDYNEPEVHPFSPVAACRAFYWMKDKDPAKAKELAMALYIAAMRDNQDISTAAGVAKVGASIGLDQKDIIDAVDDNKVKLRLMDEVDAAKRKGVFGSPFFIVDGEPFWGVDRLEIITEWLETDGF